MKNKLKKIISFLLHGSPKQIYAKVFYLKPHKRLEGKSIIITGGGRGLGYAMASRFAAEGAKVLIAGRNVDVLSTSAQKIGCEYLVLDMGDVNGFPNFIEKANKLLGSIDILVNNAGISLHEDSFFSVSPEQFETQFDTNLKGAFFLTQHFMDLCRTNGTTQYKKVLFVSSETGVTVDERPYGLTKAAMNSLVQGLAHKYAKEGFRINAIAPGITCSDMTGGKADGNLLCPGNMTERYYLPEEMAEIACFLISDAANLLNGQILVCNEGKTLNARWR